MDVLVGANTLQDDTNISGPEDTGQLQAGERSSSGIAQSKLWTVTSGTRPDTVPSKRISPAGTETRAESDPRAKLEWTLPGLPGQESLCVCPWAKTLEALSLAEVCLRRARYLPALV